MRNSHGVWRIRTPSIRTGAGIEVEPVEPGLGPLEGRGLLGGAHGPTPRPSRPFLPAFLTCVPLLAAARLAVARFLAGLRGFALAFAFGLRFGAVADLGPPAVPGLAAPTVDGAPDGPSLLRPRMRRSAAPTADFPTSTAVSRICFGLIAIRTTLPGPQTRYTATAILASPHARASASDALMAVISSPSSSRSSAHARPRAGSEANHSSRSSGSGS